MVIQSWNIAKIHLFDAMSTSASEKESVSMLLLISYNGSTECLDVVVSEEGNCLK